MQYFKVLFIVVFFTLAYIIMIYYDTKGKSKRERFGKAVEKFAKVTADNVSEIARNVTETSSDKNLRLAKEAFGRRNGDLFSYSTYSDMSRLDRLFEVDESFRQHLQVLKLSDERWRELALRVYYIGVLCHFSRFSDDKTIKVSEGMRQIAAYPKSDTSYFGETRKNEAKAIALACAYLKIDIAEWIKYGDAVVSMYNLLDHPDLRQYCVVDTIR